MKRPGPYVAISTHYLTNRKVRRVSPHARLLHLTSIMWSADQRNDGYVPEEMVDVLLVYSGAGREHSQELVLAGLWDLVDDGYEVHDYLDWNLSNEAIEGQRELGRERQRRSRDASVTRDSTVTDAKVRQVDVDVDVDVEENTRAADAAVVSILKPPPPRRPPPTDRLMAFEAFWQEYPRKIGKKAARAAWDRAVRSTPHQDIIVGLRRALPELRKKDPEFIPHPTTWLNQGRWEDEGPAAPTKPVAPRGETRLCGGCDHDVVLAAGRCPTYGAVADIPTIAEIAGKPEIEICRGWEWINGRRPQGTVDRVARVDDRRDRGTNQERQEGPGRDRALVGEPREVRGHERRPDLLPHRPAG